jgi:aspartate/methionine/tyrosine aminotransferase
LLNRVQWRLTCHVIASLDFVFPGLEAVAVSYQLFLTKLLIRSGIARFLPSVRRWTEGGGAFVHYYSDRILTAPHRQLRDAGAFMELHGPDAIDLALGAPRFDLVPSGSTKLPADRRGWPPPWGLPELQQAVADKLRGDNHLSVHPPDEVLVTHGAAGAFSVVLDTFVNCGDLVVVFDPCSPLYSLALRHRRARIRWIPTWMDSGRVCFDFERLVRPLRGPRLLIINSPNNPTGGVIPPEDLERIAWWAGRRDTLIVSDEVFERYYYDGSPLSIGTLPAARRRTLTIGSLSKGHGLASARVGWLAGCRHLIRPCALSATLHTPFVPTICQQVALTALRQPTAAFQPLRAEFESRRCYTYERLQTMGLKPYWPAGAFSFWVPVQELGVDGHAFASRLLKTKRVLVSPGDFFGPSGRGHIRLSYAAEDGRLREGLSRLDEFVRSLQSFMSGPGTQAA